MRYTVSATTTFDAGHQLPGTEECSKPHGHRWTATVEMDGEMSPRRRPHEERLLLLADLRKLADELDGRDLNQMLPAAQPTLENIAIQLMERLRFQWTRITRVTISQDVHTSVSIENEAVP